MSNYLPILTELFESDSLSFFLVGAIVGVILGINSGCVKRCRKLFLVFFLIYVACELVSALRFEVNYLIELFLLLIGTYSLGSAFGYIVSLIVLRIKKAKTC